MIDKKRGLGRGLSALLGDKNFANKNTEPAKVVIEEFHNLASPLVQEIPVDLISRSSYQPRRTFAAEPLAELADSIRAQGILQPLVVRKRPGHKDYEIIAGERRWRAAQQAELSHVPVIIRDVDDKTAMALALIENVQRQDLSPLDEALALQRLINEFELNQQELAELIGKSRTTITNLLRLLNLEPDVQAFVNEGKLELGHAKVLLGLSGSQQKQAAHQVVQQQLSVRATERLVKQFLQPNKVVQPKTIDPDVQRLQHELSGKLGAAVIINHSRSGKGEMIIKYYSNDELSGILEHIK